MTLGLRRLPPREVTNTSIDDAYVAFIFYCNPAIPMDTDSSELRKSFRAVPKSDGKTFSTWVLFDLICKFDKKELKTWAQVAVELGVEPPVLDKGQSAQKVQQYAVRLKRWMHAMHIDAFFEFLLGKEHVYWTRIPKPDEPPTEVGRDGVVAEEDLAIRALLPETRPKRGRRKAEDRDNDSENGNYSAQRRRFHSPTLSEDFALDRSSIPDSTPASAYPGSGDLGWDSADARASIGGRMFGVQPMIPFPSTLQASDRAASWRTMDGDQTPMTAHPQSAITPRTRNPFLPDDLEPRSAIPSSKARSRRRHGPAVSSAWPNYSGTAVGKLRGRPPTNRSITNGPFSTFPVNLTSSPSPAVEMRDRISTSTLTAQRREEPTSYPSSAAQSIPIQVRPPGRPGLQLQVPERKGGAVRLATPPPKVLLNGENHRESNIGHEDGFRSPSATPSCHFPSSFALPGNASMGASQAGDTAEGRSEADGDDRTNVETVENSFMLEILKAEWYSEHGGTTKPCSFREARHIAQSAFRRLREDSTSNGMFLTSLCSLAGGSFLKTRLIMTRLASCDGLSAYEARWTLKLGSIEESFSLRIPVEQVSNPVPEIGANEELGEVVWREKYMALRDQMQDL